jgi:hypothetical protein
LVKGEIMPRNEQFVISAVPDIGVAQDGRRCLVHMTDFDGKRLDAQALCRAHLDLLLHGMLKPESAP